LFPDESMILDEVYFLVKWTQPRNLTQTKNMMVLEILSPFLRSPRWPSQFIHWEPPPKRFLRTVPQPGRTEDQAELCMFSNSKPPPNTGSNQTPQESVWTQENSWNWDSIHRYRNTWVGTANHKPEAACWERLPVQCHHETQVHVTWYELSRGQVGNWHKPL
jgi:hypothetical protein